MSDSGEGNSEVEINNIKVSVEALTLFNVIPVL